MGWVNLCRDKCKVLVHAEEKLLKLKSKSGKKYEEFAENEQHEIGEPWSQKFDPSSLARSMSDVVLFIVGSQRIQGKKYRSMKLITFGFL